MNNFNISSESKGSEESSLYVDDKGNHCIDHIVHIGHGLNDAPMCSIVDKYKTLLETVGYIKNGHCNDDDSLVYICKGGIEARADSMLQLSMLHAEENSKITIQGKDDMWVLNVYKIIKNLHSGYENDGELLRRRKPTL